MAAGYQRNRLTAPRELSLWGLHLNMQIAAHTLLQH